MSDATLVSSLARVKTPKARGYLTQLCKHFAHKIPASFADNHGVIQFAAARCELNAAAETLLQIECSAPDDNQLCTVEDVVERHLRRFAFKELLSIRWVRLA
jgi:hypothetical protein